MLSIGAGASERADAIHDVAPPVPVAVSIESSPPDGRDAYPIGATISVRVTFDEAVTVDQTAGSPSLALTLGDRKRRAIYSNGSNTRHLVFRYRVTDGDADADGVAVPADGLALNDGSIRDAADNPTVLTTPAVSDQPGQRVDGEQPNPIAVRAVSVAGREVSIAFDEPLDEGSVPAIDAFHVIGEESAYSVTSVSVEGASVWLALSPAVPEAEAFVSLTYMEPVHASAPSIRDTVGNAAASFGSDWYAESPETADRASRAARELRTTEKESIGDILARKTLRTPAQRKVSSQLLDARRAQVQEPTVTAEPVRQQTMEAGAMDERVLVDIRADVTPEVLARIRELGGTVVNSVPRYRSVRAELPLAAVESLAELDEVQAIRPADMPVTHRQLPEPSSVVRTGTVHVVRSSKEDTSEGDVAHRADVARSTYGVDGTGIGVGVISDGVETLADQQATGDVAARVTVLPGRAGGPIPFACGGRSNGSEGTALLEIVHDLAPGAELFFADGISGAAQMAQNIEDLCTAGADIIVDDIKYLGAAFQDDVIARAVSTVTANGCHYFSAAGNGGNKNDETASVWEGDFTAGSALDLIGVGSGLVVHDFGGGVTGNEITKDSTLSIVLEWSDPAGGSANDYDLFLIGADNLVNSGSANTQDGTQDPIESIRSSCSPNREGDRLVIIKNAGAEDRYLRLSYAREGLAITTAGHTFGHAASEDAIGVAAVDVADAGGADGVFDGTESVETYSSDGPRRIFFEADGTPITPGDFSSTGGRVLQKPDLAAADGVSTSTPGFSTFRGTSAAAPHAAAIAALMLEAAGGSANVTQDDLRAAMTGAALDIEAMGVDRDSGAGIVMAPGAVDAVDVAVADRNGAPTVANAPADQTLAPGGDAVTIELTGVFSDPDDDPLTYTVWLSNAERLSLSGLTGTAFTLTPLAPGRYVVTVVATDPEGLSAVLTFEVTVTVGDRDYDADDDGLIEVGNLAQLHAMRFDLDGDGLVDEPANWSQYHMAFVEGSWDMGCPAGCIGYELTADLDFDTDGDGDIGAGDDYWNNGRGWRPVGAGNAFRATFEGNGHTVSNLFIHRNRYAGLFGTVVDGVVRGVGLLDVDVTGDSLVGGLVGYKGDGEISGSYVTGSVSGDDYVGGLVGRSGAPFVDDESHSAVTGSYSTAHVSGREFVGGLVGLGSVITASYATGHVEGTESVGGLVGRNDHPITASYATGRVEGRENVGGLVGFGTRRTTITAAYATGLVSGDEKVGGLVGWDRRTKAERFSASYWDIHTSGHAIGPRGRTTTELQAPTDYGGIYRTWNVDLDGDTVANDPWDFGTSAQYPVLAVDLDGNGEATWKEFGHQLRAGPVLTASTSAGQPVVLTWSAADTSHWSPPPELAYTLIRDDGTTVEILASNLAGLRYTDSDVTAGAAYTYQVAAVVDGGAPARSALVEVVAGVANQPPMIVVGTLRDRTLQVGASEVVDVAGAFSDLDDALTYAASSSDVDVARVSVSGAQVTITSVAAGRTTITVTATETGSTNRSVTQSFQVLVWTGTGFDYDADDDGLIDIATLAQLDAVRYDLDGDGVPVHRELEAGFSVEVEPVVYAEAFPAAATGMGCPSGGGCTGYELETDLDFDTNGDGRADAGDEYWDHGKGWEPISEVGFAFRAVFEGNRHTIRNLFIRRFTAGLFGGNAGVIRRVRLIDVDVSATAWVGGLVAQSRGEIHASYVTGRVAGEDWVGGLVGSSFGGLAGTSGGGTITASYSTARVTGTDKWVGGLVGVNSGAISGSYATGRVSGYGQVGGLIGCHIRRGSVVASYATGIVSGRGDVGGLIGSTECSAGSPVVTASYATGRVSGRSNVGGLIGLHCGSLAAGYATGPVWGGSHVGGLIGSTGCSADNAVVTASYWDTVTSGLSSSAAGTGQTTSALQAPTDYSGAIYADWNVDLDGNGTNDDPWDFGTASQYPALKMNFDGQGATTWQEFGRQLRAGPTLTAKAGATGVTLIWTAVDTSHWSPAPAVTYTLYRDGRTGVKILAENLSGLGYTDTDVTVGETYTYGVAAVITGGEATRGAVVVDLSVNSPPVPVGTLPDRWLHVGDAAGVEAGEAFEDPEDDALTYTAASSATGVATVSVSGTRVTITPVAAGTATITVTATDAGGSSASTTQAFTVTVLPSSAIDYDTDDDGLIEISHLAQLDAVRHDLNGSGRNFDAVHAEAFPDGGDVLACGGLLGCVGYELNADLDFDTDRSGEADAGDAYWNDGAGWAPIGDSSGSVSGFGALFEGNGRTITHLFIDSSENDIGLFGATRSAAVIRNLEMVAVLVTGTDNVGGLAGSNGGAVSGCYATGKVSGDDIVGGLVGANLDDGSASASYSTVQVTGDDRVGGLAGSNRGEVTAAYATGRVVGDTEAGGLLGRNTGDVNVSYATGRVSGRRTIGGLVGWNSGDVKASYATGLVSGGSKIGGLVGDNTGGGAITDSYWDTDTSGWTTGSGGQGQTTAELQLPTAASGIYQTWNLDLDGDGMNDDPWDFGTSSQYPALKANFDGQGTATWQEFGQQIRAGPALMATPTVGQVTLTWSVISGGTYNLYRTSGTTVEILSENTSSHTYVDTDVTAGATYVYQVAAVINGGEASRSPRVSVVGPMMGDVESTTVTLTLDPLEVRESAASRTVRVTGTLDGGARPTPTVVAVTVGTGGDSATEGTDYQDVGDLELTIPANRTDGTVTFTLRPTNDRTAEGTETISVSGNVAGLAVAPAELALADDDVESTRLDLSLEPSAVSEAAAPTEVSVTASLDAGARTTDSTVTVTVGASGDSATEGSDYAFVSTLAITIPANETSGQTMFTLRPQNDAIAEGAETITIGGRASGLAVAAATLTLSDDDRASRVVTLAVEPESVSEDTPADVTVTASLDAGARAEDTAVRLTVGAAGDTAVPGTDYERVSERTLTIPAGETGGTAVFRLEPFDNDAADGARTLSVTGSTTVAELRIEPASGARIALADDDSPAVLVTPDRLTVVEAASNTYTVELQTRPTADVTVTITGVSGDLSLDRTSLVFTRADWRDPQDVTVTAADDADSVQDPDVTLTHRASGAAEYRGLRAELVVSIRENDPSLVFSDSALSVPEGQTATYTVALATLPTADVTVRVTGVSGDLSLDRSRLQFTRGDWDDAQTITVAAAEDDDTSTDAAVTLTHRASGGGYDGIAGTLRVTIAEDDRGGGTGGGSGGGSGGGGPGNRPPVVTEPIGAQVLEVEGSVRIDATEHFRDPERRTMTFEAESADVSVATVEVDGSIVTVAGIAHGVTTVTVTAVDHRRLRVSQGFAVSVGRQVSFARPQVSAPEGGTATLTVVINRPRDVATSLDYVVGPDDDPATADADAADHDGVGGTVVIAAQAMEATIALAVHDDTDIEPPRETFAVTLRATEAQLQDFGLGVATVRVTIDEGVCDRTRQVRNALRRSLPCAAVSATDLGGRRDLDLANTGLAALRGADLSGLSGLTVLDLSGNALTSLPAGLFAGLGALGEVRLQDNPGAPFALRLGAACARTARCRHRARRASWRGCGKARRSRCAPRCRR